MDERFFDHQLVGDIYGRSVAMLEGGGFSDVDASKNTQRFADVAAQALVLELVFGDSVPLHVVLPGGSPEKRIADGRVGLLGVGFEGLKPGPQRGIGEVDGRSAIEDHSEGVNSGGAPGRVRRAGVEEGGEVSGEAGELIAEIVLAARVAARDFGSEAGEFCGVGERGLQRGIEFGNKSEYVSVRGTAVDAHGSAVIFDLAGVAGGAG